MHSQQKIELDRYFKLKNQVDLPLKIKLYFSMFQNALDNQQKSHKLFESKKGFSKALLHAFTNLSPLQKGTYLLWSLNFVLEQLDRLEKQRTKSDSILEADEIKNIETTCEMLFTTMKIHHWSAVHFKLDKSKKIISIINKKKSLVVNIRQYYVRRSRKYKNAIVMEAISQQITNQAKKYIFSFSTSIIQRIFEEVLKCVLLCQGQKLLALIEQQEEQDKQSHLSTQSNQFNKALVFLSSTNLNEYLLYKQKTQKQCLTQKFDFKPIYQNQNLDIQHSSKFEKIYKMENIIENYNGNYKEDFINAFYNKNKYIQSSKILEEFSKKYKAVYEKYIINKKIQQMISIREENTSNQQEDILFMKSIENIMSKNYIDFLYVKVRNISPTKMKLIIYLSVGESSKKLLISTEIIKYFMIQLNEMVFRPDVQQKKKKDNQPKFQNISDKNVNKMEQDSENQEQDQFTTVKGDSEQFVQFFEDDEDYHVLEKNQQIMIHDSSHQNQNKKDILVLLNSNRQLHMNQMFKHDPQYIEALSSQYLHKRYITQPLQPVPYDKKQRMIQHYLFKQWIRLKNGGVICTNMIKVNVQKNLFKNALTKLGKNFLKGEILRMSLPIELFKKQSHLETIGRNFCYTPLFLEKLSTPIIEKKMYDQKFYHHNISKLDILNLQRVKECTLLAISVGTVGISLDKPFNPILGETIQLWIDDCPMYLQQISHHPPIGAYYFKGRGYTVHGMIEPKVNFGMNNVKGFSQRPNYINFYNKDETEIESTIEISFGKMIIKGILFGERQFNFQDRIYAYDKNNHIFSEIYYSCKKKQPTKKNTPLDYVHGKIYKLKQEFVERFNGSMPRIFPNKQYIIEELSSFEGVWNESVKFDNIQYINFKTDFPCQLIHEKDVLLSNSSYRTDLQRLIQDNLPEAQKQKDSMQDWQRRDKKLRESYKYKKN